MQGECATVNATGTTWTTGSSVKPMTYKRKKELVKIAQDVTDLLEKKKVVASERCFVDKVCHTILE